MLFINGILDLAVFDNSITTGQPGVGVIGATGGNVLARADLGQFDNVAPNAVAPATIGVMPFPNRVDFQWQGVADNLDGSGIYEYAIYRNGTYLVGAPPTTFSDQSVAPSTTYSYVFYSADFHGNASSPTTITVTTPPASSLDPRRVGVRPNGSYWGDIGEQIDVGSGNLNYTVPLIKAMGRGGWGVGFNLTYNSQNWRKDTGGGIWNVGRDVGYGYGWKLLAGSLVPYYFGFYNLHHFIFADSTGAEYRLDQNVGGVWSSKESAYVWYDSNVGRLYFRDGSFWVLGSTSGGTEQDAGTMYPTLMEDTNGNQVTVSYLAGAGLSLANSSARIDKIADVRNGPSGYGYSFGYNGSHLASISNFTGTAESYWIGIGSGQALNDPFGGASFGTTSVLQSVTQQSTGLITSLQYDAGGSVELTTMITPYNGHIRWSYQAHPLSGGVLREVLYRYVAASAGGQENAFNFARDPADATRAAHAYGLIQDTGADAEKAWFFQTDGSQPEGGLVLSHEDRVMSTHAVIKRDAYTWATNGGGNEYISNVLTTLDPGVVGSVQKQTAQVQDQYGNVTQQTAYNFGNLVNPIRTYTNAYLGGANYSSRYIFNRLVSSTVTDNLGYTATLASNRYDELYTTDVPGMTGHDASYNTALLYRGNVTTSTTPGGTAGPHYDIGGNVTSVTQNGVTTSSVTGAATNWAAPSSITTNALTTSLNWNSALAPTQQTGPNGDTASIAYDGAARPATNTSSYGAVTTYAYGYAPATKTATTNGHWVRTTTDGFGRTVKTETGDATSTKSVVDTAYAPCACSPLGKMYTVSQPHLPNAAQSWTTYTYDKLGRTVKTVAADGLSATNYVYLGNTVGVTDPAGNAKTYVMDALGQLITVTEPGSLVTTYGYDVLGHLTSVSMPRSTYTQTRTFNYAVGTTVGALVLSATNPETGTVTYTYNSDNTLASKHDAKGQVFTYAYDGYKRVQTVSVGGSLLRSYIYDSNTLDSTGFSQYTLGRLAAVQNASSGNGMQFTEMYSYAASGLPVGKRLQVNQTVSYVSGGISQQGTGQRNLDATYSYNSEGQASSVTYPTTYPSTDGLGNPVPASGPSYTYGFDTMSRPVGLTDQASNTVVNGVSYGPANELLGMTYNGIAEVRNYNSMLQLIGLSSGSYVNMQYVYPAGANNGKVCLQSDLISHEQSQYGYDMQNRLSSATAWTISGQPSGSCTLASGSLTWGQSYAYDGYGSLTDKNVTAGSAPSLHVTVDPATNRVAGQYDANGNMTAMAGNVSLAYDSENRLSQWANYNQGTSATHGYDSQNKRVWVWSGGADQYGNPNSYQVYFYGLNGKRLGVYQVTMSVPVAVGRSATLLDSASSTETYFGSRRLAPMDRLGSVPNPGGTSGHSTYYPYGEDKAGNPGGDGWKFATYSRDGGSGLDYADQRFYASSLGRFTSTDLSGRVHDGDPQSWNKYAYTAGDPVNRIDPSGLYYIDPEDRDWWDWAWWGGIGFSGGGGGAPATPLLRPDPNWQTSGQVSLRVALWDAAIAAALIAEQNSKQPGFRYVAELEVVGDCYVSQVFGGGSVVRERTYEVLDQFGQPFKSSTLTISEHNYVQSGSLQSYNSSFSPDDKGKIYDLLSRGNNPDTVEFQQFTATNTSGLNSFGGTPIMIYDPSNPNGPFFGTLGITLRQHTVFINGSDGKINGQLNYCHED